MKHLEDTPWFICDKDDENYCAYVDTDSNYFNAEPILLHLFPDFEDLPDRENILLMTALGTNPIAHPSTCIKRESLSLSYDENLPKCEDFDLWLRFFLSNSLNIKVLEFPITTYDISRSFGKDKDNALAQIKIRLK